MIKPYKSIFKENDNLANSSGLPKSRRYLAQVHEDDLGKIINDFFKDFDRFAMKVKTSTRYKSGEISKELFNQKLNEIESNINFILEHM